MKKIQLRIWVLTFLYFSFLLPVHGLSKWTIMIYLDGDNNLEKYAINDFLEIASVGSTPEINFIVQFDRISGYDSRYDNWTNTQRFRITKNMEPTISNAIQDWGDGFGGREVNSGDPESLSSFVRWAKQNYPADYYALVLWDHGDGWRSMTNVAENIEQQLKQSRLSLQERSSLEKTLKELKRKIHARRYQKSVCFDSTSFDELTLKEIRQALSDPDCYVDIIAFDACLMGMIEVAYEIRNCATYMVASEETIYTTGFPYTPIAQDIVNNPDDSPLQFCIKIVQHYADYYGHYGTETLSAIDLTFCNQIFEAINNFCQTAIEIDNQWLYFYIAISQTSSFDDPDYKDLKTFFEIVFDNAS
ncbi:MAG: clostripain-related cysteine peptidase, partial [Candidatus Omnitrophica bacterium]|nr:clostripain-related cysteine peptidase [Candidatus Omnitrophota bacterium]